MKNPLKYIMDNKIVMIYRGFTPDQCTEITKELIGAGIRVFEVTMNTPGAIEAIKLLKNKYGKQALIGAGTVTTVEHVQQAKDAGASFIISPNYDAEVVKMTKRLDLISIPGAFTPSEIVDAYHTGADIVKVFPINVVGSEYIAQLNGPLDYIPLLASGAVKLDMVKSLYDVGVETIGIGAQLLGEDLLDNKDWDGIRKKATEYMEALKLKGVAANE